MKIYNKTINKYLAAILFTSVLATACEKRLDVFPYQSISDDKALLSEGDVKVTLIGAYDGAQAATVYGGDIMVMNELAGNGENINFTGTFSSFPTVPNLPSTNSLFCSSFSAKLSDLRFGFV